MNITEIIGIDDWLIFGCGEDHMIYFTVCEVWGVWLDTPNKGQSAYDSYENNADWAYVIRWAEENKQDLYWQLTNDFPGAAEDGLRSGHMSPRELENIRRNLARVLGRAL